LFQQEARKSGGFSEKSRIFNIFLGDIQRIHLFTQLFKNFFWGEGTDHRITLVAGVDSAWEQKKLEARKMPVNCAREAPMSLL
jgi:hypothetical protein